MSGRYKAYEEYKDSNIQFLGNIPTNWHVGKIKSMLSLKRELVGSKSSAFQLLSLTLKGIIHRDISSGEGKIPASFETYQSLEKGELVFCLFDIDETPRTVGISSQNGMITGAYNIYRNTENCVPNYAYYYFLHIDSFKGLKPFYTGLRKVVRTETFANIEMFCPSLLEQTQIAAFLDHETAKIDTLIDKQQQLIELLKEKRQAVISHAVTKGLDPDVPMKDSGVEWVNKIPHGWFNQKLRWSSHIYAGGTPSKTNLTYWENGTIPWINSGAVNQGLILEETTLITHSAYINSSAKWIIKGSLVIALAGQGKTKGMVAQVGINTTCNQSMAAIVPWETERARYLFWWLNNNYENIRNMSGGDLRDGLNLEHIGDIHCPKPTHKECNSISLFLDHETAKIDKLIDLQLQQIELLKERRTALISAAVTGKIDVRDWQILVTQTESDEVMA